MMRQKLVNLKKFIFSKAFLRLLLLLLLLGVTAYTRFYDLGYSDYIGDEHKAFIELEEGQNLTNFFLSGRKGPMQFFVSHIPYLITGNFRNELAQRIPFAVVSLAAVVAFYFTVKKITKSFYVGLLAAFLLAVNGFTVGFGRIAQYQNLNLLFNFLTIYFYYDLVTAENNSKILRSSLLGTLFWSLSVLSHWDAIFIFPVVVIIFLRFLFNKNFQPKFKTKLILYNFLWGSFLLLPFLIPYVSFQLSNEDNKTYFFRRIELGHLLYQRYILLINLYNPFLTLYLLLFGSILGAVFIKRSYIFTVWFLFAYICFELFVRKPGTHIYNFIIPLTVLTAVAAVEIYKILPGLLKKAWVLASVLVLTFLTYQTHFIFIDHKQEYPWEQKTFLDLTEIQDKRYKKKRVRESEREYYKLETKEYDIDQKLPLFGFPHKRYWNQINNYVNQQNRESGQEMDYISNEVKTISEWYMDADYGNSRPFYLVGIKNPLSFVDDYKWPQIGNKNTVHEIENEYGETVVRIYKARKEDESDE